MWNGIHKDVEDYVTNDGLTDEMRERNGGHGSGGRSHRSSRSSAKAPKDQNVDEAVSVNDSYAEEDESESSAKPIGLDESAKEQKKDKALRQ